MVHVVLPKITCILDIKKQNSRTRVLKDKQLKIITRDNSFWHLNEDHDATPRWLYFLETAIEGISSGR